MVFVIFCAHEMAAVYASQLRLDQHINRVSFGTMTIKHKWTTMQQWVINNWESYLVVHVGQVPTVTFNRNQDTLLPYTAFSVPGTNFISLPLGKALNYGQKPLAAMTRLILQFSNPSNTVIDTFASTHTTSLAALLAHCHSIAFEASQEQWTAAQSHLPILFDKHSTEEPEEEEPPSEPPVEIQPEAEQPPAPVYSYSPPQSYDPTVLQTTTTATTTSSSSSAPASSEYMHTCVICGQSSDKDNIEICLNTNCSNYLHTRCFPVKGQQLCSKKCKKTKFAPDE